MPADIFGTSGPDSLAGTTDADSILGGDGNDTLNGGAGSDTVNGGEGADRLIWDGSAAGGEHDVYIGGDGHTPIYSGGYISGSTGSENYDFSPYGHSGGDSLVMGQGSGADLTITYSTTEAGLATDSNGNTLDFSGIERVFLGDGNHNVDASGATPLYTETGHPPVGMRLYSGNGNDTITGSSGTDYIQSGGGDDFIQAGAGNDVIETGAGDDTALGGDGDDGYRWGNGNSDEAVGNDLYDGEGGFNTLNAWQSAPDASGAGNIGTHVELDSSSSGYIEALDLNGNTVGTLRFLNMQNLRTGAGADTIDGSQYAIGATGEGYRVFAERGDDLVIGSGGRDTLEGGEGADTINGGGGDDFISMNGDIFSQVSRPDRSVDTLVVEDGAGADTIRGFSFGGETDADGNPLPADRLDVSNLHDADGNPVDLGDVVVRADTNDWGNPFAVISFPNGEELWFGGVDPADFTPQRLHQMGIPCFCRDTLILTPSGEVPVQDLRVGDLVMTRNHGPQPVRWIGTRGLDKATLTLRPKLQPIRIAAGSLGHGLPRTALCVSPQHRILLRSAIARRMFGTDEVLVAAVQLTAADGIEQLNVLEVEYWHLLFDQHEIVFSNGAETESLYTGAEALRSLGEAAREEIFTLFPQLRDEVPEPARPFIPGHKARNLVLRHQRNGKVLVQ